MTRRGVLTGAAALAGAGALPQFLIHTRRAVGHVILDSRLAASADFASGFNGTHVHPVNALEDLCSRWYRSVRRQVLADAGHIAGLSTWMDYVIMRSCAAEIGYTRAFHAEHVPGAATMEHIVSAHPQGLTYLTRLGRPDGWAQAIGRALAEGAHLRWQPVPGQLFGSTTAATASAHVRMVTWLFSPRTAE